MMIASVVAHVNRSVLSHAFRKVKTSMLSMRMNALIAGLARKYALLMHLNQDRGLLLKFVRGRQALSFIW
jgi:hypothetical protein